MCARARDPSSPDGQRQHRRCTTGAGSTRERATAPFVGHTAARPLNAEERTGEPLPPSKQHNHSHSHSPYTPLRLCSRCSCFSLCSWWVPPVVVQPPAHVRAATVACAGNQVTTLQLALSVPTSLSATSAGALYPKALPRHPGTATIVMLNLLLYASRRQQWHRWWLH